jgi:hypothetical protein
MKVGDRVKVKEVRSRTSKLLHGKLCKSREVLSEIAFRLEEETDNIQFGGVWLEELTLVSNKINIPKEML